MQFALLIYESPEAFAARKSDGTDPYTGAWRAYHKALVESGVFVGGDPLEVPETGTTIRIKEGKRGVQDGPYADTKEQLGGFTILELPSLDAAEDGLSDALIKALTAWPRDGVPQNPEAWLLTTARHSIIDAVRHQRVV